MIKKAYQTWYDEVEEIHVCSQERLEKSTLFYSPKTLHQNKDRLSLGFSRKLSLAHVSRVGS